MGKSKMFAKILIVSLLFITPLFTYSQILRKIIFSTELGGLVSIGENTYRTTVLDNGISTIISPKNYRYKYPSIRLRGATHYILSQKIHAGISTGLNVRYLENYGASKNKTTISIPVMGTIEYVLIDKDRIGLSVNAGIGHNFMNIKSGIYTDKGGITYQSGISFKKKKHYERIVSYNIGYEHQADNVSFIFPRSGSNTGFYNIKYKQFRNQLYFSVRFEF
jgi:hypothetical protein